MHNWSDKNFDWEELSKAEDVIYFWAKRVGRIGGQLKEKYGTIRFYAYFTDFGIHNLLYPGWVWIKHPKLYWFEYSYLQPTVYLPLSWLWRKYQEFIYNFAYRRAVRLHPKVRIEILMDIDFPELVSWAFVNEGKRRYVTNPDGTPNKEHYWEQY